MKRNIYYCYAPVKPYQRHVIIYFPSFFFIFRFTDCYLWIFFLNSSVTLSPILSGVSLLTQTLEIPLLYGILIVTNILSPNLLCVSPLIQTIKMLLSYGILIVIDKLQPPHLLTSLFFFFFPYKFSIVLSLKIDWYDLQWDNFLSVFSVLSIMTQVCLPKSNQMSARDR